MGQINRNIVVAAHKFVENQIENRLSEDCVFHSKNHTNDVLKNVQIIGDYCKLNEDEMNIVQVCAIFHDVGYVIDYANHEYESAKIASEFLITRNIDTENVNLICNTILATKIPQNPKNILERILCDADLMHLTYEDYFTNIELMRQEWANVGKADLSEFDFHKSSLKFFKFHHYHTEYGKNILDSLKLKTERRIKNKLLSEKQTNYYAYKFR